MGDRHPSWRVSSPQKACPANAIGFYIVIGISAKTSRTGVTAQVKFARWSHRSMNDLLWTGLQLPGNRLQPSH
eukprot:1256651-Pyramimonas_sp.AAC.1